MELNRLKHTIRLWLTLGSGKRTEYLRSHKVFASIGENCSIMDRRVPLYANLIRIGNNVHIAAKVSFVTHDITHVMLNQVPQNECPYCENKRNVMSAGGGINEKVGCIEIGDNVFIGTHTVILPDVRIGSNVIIGACSLINHDIPDNSVVGGVPARVIGDFASFYAKRQNETHYPTEIRPKGQIVGEALSTWCWNQFYEKRKKTDSTPPKG